MIVVFVMNFIHYWSHLLVLIRLFLGNYLCDYVMNYLLNYHLITVDALLKTVIILKDFFDIVAKYHLSLFFFILIALGWRDIL